MVLIDKYRITTDRYQYIVCSDKSTQNGNISKSCRYFQTLKGVADYIDNELLKTKIEEASVSDDIYEILTKSNLVIGGNK